MYSNVFSARNKDTFKIQSPKIIGITDFLAKEEFGRNFDNTLQNPNIQFKLPQIKPSITPSHHRSNTNSYLP